MEKGNTLPRNDLRYLLFFALLAYLLPSCQDDTLEVPTKEEFTKPKMEAFGKMLSNELLATHDFLPEMTPYDTSIYWYVNTLYQQATSVMKLDKQSPVDNRWNQERPWKVFIINDDTQQHAYALPGGDLFITTGMLKSFEREYELYYLLTFEAALMNEGHLLNRLIEEYNSLTINNLIEGRTTGNQVTIEDVAADLPQLVFDGSAVEMTDEETVASVCGTSILEPTGINPALLSAEFQNSAWLQTRPSYGGRTARILQFADDNVGSCGGVKGTGNYQRFVLNVLP